MPTNFNDMGQFINMIKTGNPESFVVNLVKQSANQGNPMMMNLLNLINSGNTAEIETMARNVAREKGIDFDKEFNNFKQMFKL